MRRGSAIFSSLVLVSAVAAMSCSSPMSPLAPPPSTACVSTPVSFRKDVAPTFLDAGCSSAGVCHGQPNYDPSEDLFLGDNSGMTPPKTLYDGLVGVISIENPAMPLVDPMGSTANSYLWHKIAGDQNTNPAVTAGCMKATTSCDNCSTMPPCGAAMPDLTDALEIRDLAQFCTIQNWIEQGAKND